MGLGWRERLLDNNLNRQVCFLSSFAMILVVIGHSDITDDYKQLFIYKWVYGFHMPLFFFVSGFLFAYTTPKEKLERLDLRQFYNKKIKRLLIPFFFFNTLFFFVKATLISPEQMQHPVELTYNSFVHYTFFSPIGYLWFLPTLFILFLFFVPFIQRFARIDSYRLALLCVGVLGGILSIFLPSIFEVDRAFAFLPYFIAGYLYCLDKETIDVAIKKNVDITLSMSLILSIILLNNWSYISGFAGIVFAVSLSLTLESRIGDYTVIFSRLTYTIFLLSYIPQMFIRGPIAHWIPTNQYFLSFLSFVSGLILPVAIGIFVLLQENTRFWKNIKLIFGL